MILENLYDRITSFTYSATWWPIIGWPRGILLEDGLHIKWKITWHFHWI